MKLYEEARAPNPRRVRIFLAEKGISVPLVPIDINKMEHKTPAFTALNPLQRTPALQLDDGTVIAESIAICRYFEELQPDPPLFGVGALGKALVEMWQRRIEFGLLGRGRGRVPSPPSGDGSDGGAAGAGMGRGQQAEGHRVPAHPRRAIWRTARSSAATPSRWPTSPASSRSTS